MTELYGVKFTKPYGSLPNRSWTALLANVPQSGIDSGLRRLTQLDSRFISFVPTALEFRDLCNPKPEDFGLPSESEAFQIAVNWSNDRVEKHKAVLHTIRLLDFYNWKQLPIEKAQKQFSKAWAETVNYAMNGGELAELIPDGQGLTYYPPTKKQKAEMSAKLNKIRKSLGNK